MARPSIVLDMSGAGPGQRTFSIGDGNVKLARGVRLVRAIPSEVRLDFEPREKRTVPVAVRFTGEGKDGYVVARYAVSPEQMGIVGPQQPRGPHRRRDHGPGGRLGSEGLGGVPSQRVCQRRLCALPILLAGDGNGDHEEEVSGDAEDGSGRRAFCGCA